LEVVDIHVQAEQLTYAFSDAWPYTVELQMASKDFQGVCLDDLMRWSADERPTWYRVFAAGCTAGCHVGSTPPKTSPSLLLF
jgi:hypothetical protein